MPVWIYLLLALLALTIAGIVFYAAMPWIQCQTCRLLLFPRYGFRVRGQDNVPETGPVMLVSNHGTWMDGFLLCAASPRPVRFLMNSDYLKNPILGHIAKRGGIIPIPATGPHAQRAAIKAAQEALDAGEVVGIFPEAQLTRNGLLGSFYRGIEVILRNRESVTVVPVYMDNLWGSIFSFKGGKFFKKRPEGLRRYINVVFGPPIAPPVKLFAARQAVLEAGVHAFEMRKTASQPLETIDLKLPSLNHPTLGVLAVSTPDFDLNGIRQTGHKPDTVGEAPPGVALRIVDDAGEILPADTTGRLQALIAGRGDWIDTGLHASIDIEGFVKLV